MWDSLFLADIPLFPTAASDHAADVDNIYFFLCLVFCDHDGGHFCWVLIVFAYVYTGDVQGGSPFKLMGQRGLELTWSIAPLVRHAGHVRLGSAGILCSSDTAQGRDGSIRDGQAVDVENSISEWRARDQ